MARVWRPRHGLGPDGVIDEIARVRAARPRRSRVPDRTEVGRGLGQRLAGRADHGRRERGGRRAGLVQGPGDHARRPVPGARGCADRRVRAQRRHGDRRDQGDVHRRGRAPARRDRRDPRGSLGHGRRARPSFEGPPEYLYGEETGLLEVDRRAWSVPARLAAVPPRRRGVRRRAGRRRRRRSRWRRPGELTDAPPTLANNVETLANVPGILAQGAEWFRSVGTDDSPGTIVCTVSGQTPRHGVAEVRDGHAAARRHRRDRRRRPPRTPPRRRDVRRRQLADPRRPASTRR